MGPCVTRHGPKRRVSISAAAALLVVLCVGLFQGRGAKAVKCSSSMTWSKTVDETDIQRCISFNNTDTIIIPSTGEVALTNPLNIVGKNTVVTFKSTGTRGTMSANISRHFTVSQEATLVLENLQLTGATDRVGGSVLLGNSTLEATDVLWSHNTATLSAGAIYSSRSSMSLLRVTFTDNRARAGSGGAIQMTANSRLQCNESSFTLNSAELDGGAVASRVKSVSYYDHVTCTSNSAQTRDGGCFIADGISVMHIYNSTFVGNSASTGGSNPGAGGAVNAAQNSTIYATAATFARNKARYGGAVSANDKADLFLTDCRFVFNFASFQSGAVNLYNVGNFTATNVLFRSNSAVEGGAMMADIDWNMRMTNVQFVSNNATDFAGALLLQNTVVVDLVNVLFEENSAQSDGGAIFMTNNVAFDCVNCSLSSNHAMLDGGSIYATDAEIYMDSGDLSGNRAEDDAGAISLTSGFLHMDDMLVFNNSAVDEGGGLRIDSATIAELHNCTFLENEADHSGAGMATDEYVLVVMNETAFLGGRAAEGAGMSVSFDGILIGQNCSFTNNTAREAGGGLVASDSSFVRLEQVSFHSNTGNYAGAISMSGSTMIGNKLTVVESTSTFSGAAFEVADSYLNLSTTVIAHNIAGFGGAFNAEFDSLIEVHNSVVTDCFAEYFGGVAAMSDDSVFLGRNTIFTHNVAQYGAVFHIQLGTVTVHNSTLNDNFGSQYAGIASVSFGRFTLDDCVVRRNLSPDVGAVYATDQSTILLRNSLFVANVGVDVGGVLRVAEDSYGGVSACRFVGNNATHGASVAGVEGDAAIIRHSTFDRDYSIQQGGSLYADDMVFGMLVVNCTFQNNTANIEGGAVYVNNAPMFIRGSLFQHNQAVVGGAVVLDAVILVGSFITNCTFLQNTATLSLLTRVDGSDYSDSFGGAIDVLDVRRLKLRNLYLEGNSADYGGGLSLYESNVDVYNSVFVRNHAKVAGGGAYFTVGSEGEASPVTFEGGNGTGNTAEYGGYLATNVYRLVAVGNSSYLEASGQPLEQTIYVYALDYYNNTVASMGNSSFVYAATTDSVSALEGSTIETTERGVAVFDGMTVTLEPGSSVVVEFILTADNREYRARTPVKFRECIVGEILANSGTICQECPGGTFALSLDATSCEDCKTGAKCPGGSVLDLKHGYWRVDETSSSVLECWVSESCQGGNDTDTQCKEGSESYYCSVCEDGYTKISSTGECKKCNSEGTQALTYGIFALLIAVLFGMCCCYRYRDIIAMKIEEFMEKLESKAEEMNLASIRTKLKILVGFIQISSQQGAVLNVSFPTSFTNFMNGMSFVNLNMTDFMNIDCLFEAHFHTRLVLVTVTPFAIMFGLALFLKGRLVMAKRLNPVRPSYVPKQYRRDLVFCALVVSFLVFASVSTTIFQTFVCETFDNGKRMLVADYKINCDHTTHKLFEAYAAIMVFVYPLGIPLGYGSVVYYYRTKINPPDKLIVREDERHLVSRGVIEEEKCKLRDTYEDIQLYTFLFENYDPRCWYFEVFECVRRLALTAIPVLIMRNTATQVVVVLLVSLVVGAVYAEVKPFGRSSDNWTSIMAQWTITLTLIAALMLKVDLSEEGMSKSAMGGILIAINCVVIAMALVTTVVSADEGEDGFSASKDPKHDEDDDELPFRPSDDSDEEVVPEPKDKRLKKQLAALDNRRTTADQQALDASLALEFNDPIQQSRKESVAYEWDSPLHAETSTSSSTVGVELAALHRTNASAEPTATAHPGEHGGYEHGGYVDGGDDDNNQYDDDDGDDDDDNDDDVDDEDGFDGGRAVAFAMPGGGTRTGANTESKDPRRDSLHRAPKSMRNQFRRPEPKASAEQAPVDGYDEPDSSDEDDDADEEEGRARHHRRLDTAATRKVSHPGLFTRNSAGAPRPEDDL